LYKLQTDRNLLWLVRPERIDTGLSSLKPGQTFAGGLPMRDHTAVLALLRLLERKDRYAEDVWRSKGEKILAEEIAPTYLGAMLKQVQVALKNLQSSSLPAEPAAVPQA
jgi:hypothetical protein